MTLLLKVDLFDSVTSIYYKRGGYFNLKIYFYLFFYLIFNLEIFKGIKYIFNSFILSKFFKYSLI
jgi:hypothetical protein